jgi:hypothetical protein
MGRRDLFTGRSGQLALMSEFLIRGINVAVPEVDIGEDIVVVRDDNDILFRVQVKTANAVPHVRSVNFSAQFNVPLRQLEGGSQNLIYAFVVRRNNRWEEFVMIRRSLLYDLRTRYAIGSEDGRGNLLLKLSFTPADITNKGLSLQPFRSRFYPWPPPPDLPKGVVPRRSRE